MYTGTSLEKHVTHHPLHRSLLRGAWNRAAELRVSQDRGCKVPPKADVCSQPC